MKVLMFGWEFPPHISGGLGTACFGLTKELSKLDVEITFVVPKLKGELSDAPVRLVGAKDILNSGKIDNTQNHVANTASSHLLKYIKINSSLRPYQNVEEYKNYVETIKGEDGSLQVKQNKSNLIDFSGDYGPDLMSEVVRYSWAGRELAQKEQFDVIHAHEWMTFLAGIEAKKISNKPLVVHIHATEFDRSGENPNRDIYHLEKYGMEMADKVIAVSKRTKNIIVHKYNIDPDKIEVVYNAVEKDDLSQITQLGRARASREKIVLFLGRITMQKGPEYFLEAASNVLTQMPDVRFVMAGSGDMARKMVEKMATLRMVDRFHFTGFLKAPERERLFAMSDLYIMPSVSEPFGITPLEAMKHGIPVIVSKQSGIAEILDNVVKVDFWDVPKLSQSIIDILNRPHLTDSMRENNRRTLESISWEHSACHVIDLYNQVIRL